MADFGSLFGSMLGRGPAAPQMGIGGFEQSQVNQMPKPMMPTIGSAIGSIFGGGGAQPTSALGSIGAGMMPKPVGVKPMGPMPGATIGAMPKPALGTAPAPKLFGHEGWLARGKQPRPGKY